MQPTSHAHDHDHHHDHEHEHAAHEHGSATASECASARSSTLLTGAFTPGEARQARRLVWVFVITCIFSVVEFIGALKANSVAIEGDALHLFIDVAALGMSLVAMRLSVRKPSSRFTFGLRRAEPLAAILNALVALGAAGEIVSEAIEHLQSDKKPDPNLMLYFALGALVVNGLSAWLLHGAIHDGHGHDHGHAHGGGKSHGHALNLRGAWVHILGDAFGAMAALVAAIVIKLDGPASVDAIGSFVIAAILVFAALKLIRDATLVLLEASPRHLPADAIREVILGFDGVAGVHDLHVWTLGAGHDAVTAHVDLVRPDPRIAARLSAHLRKAFEVEYVTIQIEVTAADTQ